MRDRGMDGLLVLSEANISYLTGYEGFSDYVPQAVLVTQDADPKLIVREMDLACATQTCWLPDANILTYAERYIGAPDVTAWEPIGDLARSAVAPDRLGVEMTAGIFGPKAYRSLLRSVGSDELLDGDGLVASCKRIKSPAEVLYIEEASAIVDNAMRVGCSLIGEGVRQADVAAGVMQALIAGVDGIAGGPPRPPTMSIGRIANAPHLKWSDRRYEKGQQTNFEMAAFRHRYACALSRTVFLGDPPARLRHLHEAVLTGFEAALGAMGPGAVVAEVERSFRRAFEPFGVRKESRIGYSIGLDWTDGGASLHSDNDTALEPGMVLHLIIGIWERTEGYVFSEVVKITDAEARALSTVPRELFVRL